MSRPLVALASLVLTVLGGVFLLFPQCASACTCELEGGGRREIVEGALSDSEAVFSGEVVDFEKGSSIAAPWPTETVSFRVSEVWKGPEQRTLEVNTPRDGMSCGYPFKEGQEYLVYWDSPGKTDTLKWGR